MVAPVSRINRKLPYQDKDGWMVADEIDIVPAFPRYVRLSPTVRIAVRNCYGRYDKYSDTCWTCPVRCQCKNNQKTEDE